MDVDTFHGLTTVLVMAAFFGIVWWAYRPAHKARFERDALLPFDETDDTTHDMKRGDKGQGS